MTIDDQVLRLIIARVLKDLLAATDQEVRADVRASWMVGDRLNGAIADCPVGAVQLRKGTRGATVADLSAFEAWVVEHRPEEWETVTTRRVRPAYVSAVLTAAKKTGTAVTADGEEIPGITIAAGEPTVAVTLADNAAELVAAAWQSGELWELIGGLLPALERADAEPTGGAS